MTTRAAPATGYDFGEKRAYRRMIWATMRSAPTGPTLLMPSIEGDEIREAESRGVHRHDLHIVDRNPAIVAHIQRRFPGITTYGVELDRAAERMEKRGVKLAAMNLDLTGPVGARSLSAIIPTVRRGVVGAYAGITVLRGREVGFAELQAFGETVGSWWARTVDNSWSGNRAAQESDYSRLLLLAAVLARGGGSELLRSGSYRSTAGNQTMLWSVWRLRASEYWIREAQDRLGLFRRAVRDCKDRYTTANVVTAERMWDRAEVARSRLRRASRVHTVLEQRLEEFWE